MPFLAKEACEKESLSKRISINDNYSLQHIHTYARTHPYTHKHGESVCPFIDEQYVVFKHVDIQALTFFSFLQHRENVFMLKKRFYEQFPSLIEQQEQSVERMGLGLVARAPDTQCDERVPLKYLTSGCYHTSPYFFSLRVIIIFITDYCICLGICESKQLFSNF